MPSHTDMRLLRSVQRHQHAAQHVRVEDKERRARNAPPVLNISCAARKMSSRAAGSAQRLPRVVSSRSGQQVWKRIETWDAAVRLLLRRGERGGNTGKGFCTRKNPFVRCVLRRVGNAHDGSAGSVMERTDIRRCENGICYGSNDGSNDLAGFRVNYAAGIDGKGYIRRASIS